MIIYHFCAARHIKKILRQGLTIGGVMEPTKTGYYLHTGWMWLTLDKNPKAQSWNTQNMIPYSWAEYRITIEIPEAEIERLYDRKRLCILFPTCDALFEGWKGSENWRVFHGVIPKEWFKGWEKVG